MTVDSVLAAGETGPLDATGQVIDFRCSIFVFFSK